MGYKKIRQHKNLYLDLECKLTPILVAERTLNCFKILFQVSDLILCTHKYISNSKLSVQKCLRLQFYF